MRVRSSGGVGGRGALPLGALGAVVQRAVEARPVAQHLPEQDRRDRDQADRAEVGGEAVRIGVDPGADDDRGRGEHRARPQPRALAVHAPRVAGQQEPEERARHVVGDVPADRLEDRLEPVDGEQREQRPAAPQGERARLHADDGEHERELGAPQRREGDLGDALREQHRREPRVAAPGGERADPGRQRAERLHVADLNARTRGLRPPG
jgi:hypothetical protein